MAVHAEREVLVLKLDSSCEQNTLDESSDPKKSQCLLPSVMIDAISACFWGMFRLQTVSQ